MRHHIFVMPRIDHTAEMTTDGQDRGFASDMETLLGREAGSADRVMRYSAQRLQPTVLAPPPDDSGIGARGVSAEDDIDLGVDADAFARRRQLLLGAAGILIAVIGTAAFLLFRPPADAPNGAPAPPAEIARPVEPIAPPPPAPQLAAPSSPVPSPQASAAPPDAAMGALSSELIPPSTDGLSPARKVNALRIVVDGDREVRP